MEESGEQSVMMTGTMRMLWLYADSSDLVQVDGNISLTRYS